MDNSNPIAFGADAQGELVIRVERSHFGDFVRGLLGQPQTIESFFPGPFDLEKNDLIQLHHLLTQRVFQQNHGELTQFTATIAWENNSSVLLNTFEAFDSYESIGGDVTASIRIIWTFLIQFHDKSTPEKQTIHWEIDGRRRLPRSSGAPEGVYSVARGCHVRIEHTARTWGMDIENLISQKMRAWTQSESWLKTFLHRQAGYVGLVAGIVMFGVIAWGLASAMLQLERKFSATAMAAKSLPDSDKLTYLIDAVIASRVMSRPEAYGGALAMAALLVSVIVGLVVAVLADNPPRGFVVLSDADRTNRKAALQKRRKGWGYFIASGLTAVIAGVLSRYLFMAWFGGNP